MAGLSLQARQTAGLVMTAELQQAIGLLQLSNQELLSELTFLAESNPLLVVTPPTSDTSDKDESPPQAEARDHDVPEDFTADGTDWQDPACWDDDPSLSQPWRDEDGADPLDSASSSPSIREALIGQIRLAFVDGTDRAIAFALMDNLDESGRLDTTIAALATSLQVSPAARLDDVRRVLMEFDPPGCFALTLAECLAAQFRARGRYDPAVATLLDHLDWLARGDHGKLRQACGLDEQDYAELLQELRSCDPRPGAVLGEPAAISPPDLFIQLSGGIPRVALNPATWPGLAIDDRLYRRLLGADAQAQSWARERHAEAQSLLRAVEQRARSLLLICEAIALHQIDFLSNGMAGLRPLTLARIAELTGLHESTVSRVTATRIIGTPQGLLPLRRFFSTGLGEEGEQVSAESIKARIRQIIATESADAVLSDDAVTQKLQESGISIQRRTVAKYREAIGIAGSAQRRRDFRMKMHLGARPV